MKKSALILLLCGVFGGEAVKADVVVQLPKEAKVLAMSTGGVKEGGRGVVFPNGTHQLVLRVEKDVGKKFDAELEYSDAMVVQFSAAETTLNLRVPEIKSAYDMKTFNSKPDLQLVGQDGNALPLKVDRLQKDGFQIMRDYDHELFEYNTRQNAATALPAVGSQEGQKAQEVQKAEKAVSSLAASEGSVSPKQTVATGQQVDKAAGLPAEQGMKEQQMAEKMLRYWYEQADEKTRKAFLQTVD